MTWTSREAAMLRQVNNTRAGLGLPRLGRWDRGHRHAHRWSEQMADDNSLRHSEWVPPGDWRVEAENVGVGPTVAEVFNAFMASPAHRANLLADDLSRVGIGIVEAGPFLWITQNFVSP